MNTSNVIYHIPCKDCPSTYCGQTSRPLHKRISEHERYTKATYSLSTDLQQSSALAHHAHSSCHIIGFSSTVILAKLQHPQQLDLVEHAAITHLSPELNRNHAAPNINAQWQPILSSICEAFKPSGISTWPSHLSSRVTLPCSLSHLSLTLSLLPVLHPYNTFLPTFCLVFVLVLRT